jgi:PPOX class probable F420-dependent enzyme
MLTGHFAFLQFGLQLRRHPAAELKMAESIETWRDLLESKKTFAHVATLMPDGTPQVTPVWIDYRNGKVLVNSAKGRVKVRNLKPGSPVAISITDPDNPYRYVQIRGRVSRVTEEGASAHIDKMAKKYLGKDKYPFAQPGEVRVLFEIEPTKVSGNK